MGHADIGVQSFILDRFLEEFQTAIERLDTDKLCLFAVDDVDVEVGAELDGEYDVEADVEVVVEVDGEADVG